MAQTVDLVRPYEIDHQFHLDKWRHMDVCVLITQRKTFDLIRLCVESLLRYYPDIPILAVDGESDDESLLYLKYKQATVPNFKLWERRGQVRGLHTSHGESLHEAIRDHITTKYVLMLDSDVIIERGGFIQDMITQLQWNRNIYATGTRMEVSDSNDAVGDPKDESDILPYAHPSLSLYDRDMYLSLPEARDHGSPLFANMQEAKKRGYTIGYYPVDKYASHASGSSWATPRPVWDWDRGVYIRPFISFINFGEGLVNQTSNDFEIITAFKYGEGIVWTHKDLIKTDQAEKIYMTSRFNIHGEYVCKTTDDLMPKELVMTAKEKAIELGAPDRFAIKIDDGEFYLEYEFVKRKVFQNIDAFK